MCKKSLHYSGSQCQDSPYSRRMLEGIFMQDGFEAFAYRIGSDHSWAIDAYCKEHQKDFEEWKAQRKAIGVAHEEEKIETLG